MQAGALDTRITIEQKTETQNDTGEPVIDWSTFAQPWARRTDLSGREYFAAQANQAEVTTKFEIYHIDGLRADMRIVCGDLTYDITDIILKGRREGIQIMARANRG